MKVEDRWAVVGLAMACVLAPLAASRLEAQPAAAGTIVNPPEIPVRRVPKTRALVTTAGADESRGGHEVPLTLTVDMTAATIFNPATGKPDDVSLRSYVSEPPVATPANPRPPFVAPTIRVFPGETVRITLRNELDHEPKCDPENVNQPHCPNTTNLHAHGLWVSPDGNSDNVLLSIRPKVTFEYEYNIPRDHPAGTFWYHPHRHGSTAMQVGSGMAGALIIQGDRPPSTKTPGDIDTLLRQSDGTPFPERVLVFQQIAYACRDPATGKIRSNANGWFCNQGDVGKVDVHKDIFQVPGTWAASGRHTTINGRTVEPFDEQATEGLIERWRMVHAGVRATLGVRIRKLRADALPYDGSSAAAESVWITNNCNASEDLPYWDIASDGLTRAAADRRMLTVLQPGYRSDVLIVFPSAGEYCVIDGPVPASASMSGVATTPRLLTRLTVKRGTPVADTTAHVTQMLTAAARLFMPADVRADIERDLQNGLLLTRFAQHGDLRSTPTARTRELTFALVPPAIDDENTPAPQPYQPDRMDRTLTLGDVEDWTLTALPGAGPHPFHIHVNPFQILSVIRKGDGADLTADPTSQYVGLKGVWKDTVSVQDDVTVTVRTQYRRYIGKFVLHCHILDHEDRGMMQNLQIVLPDGQGGQQPPGHTPHHP